MNQQKRVPSFNPPSQPTFDETAWSASGMGSELATRPPIDKHLERITLLMDKAIRIPGTDITFGLDPLLGLFLPVAGDAIGTIISAYMVIVSVRYGLPKSIITRMVFNVAADFAVGSLPLIGDWADFVFKANTRNLRLLNKYASGKRGSFWSDWAWLFLLLGALFFLVAGGLVLIFYALKQTGVG